MRAPWWLARETYRPAGSTPLTVALCSVQKPPALSRRSHLRRTDRNTLRSQVNALDNIEWLGHAGFRIKTSAGWIYIDPYRVPEGPQAAAILVTHNHFDHFSRDDVLKVAGKG